MPPSQTPTGPGALPDPVARMVAVVARTDGVEPMSDAAVLADGEHVRRIIAGPAGSPLGAAVVDTALEVGELTVIPAARGRGLGEQLWQASRELGARTWWAHGDLPAARHMAGNHRLRPLRRLWRYEMSLDASLPGVEWPRGWRLRAFQDHDLPDLLAVNREAFATLPDQGGWTAGDVLARQAAPWFRREDLLALTDGDALRGFHWTKVHGGGLGEVYVVALAPAFHGRGLGTALTVAGLVHLRRRGCSRAMLYVDADNRAAVRTYRRLGFTPVRLDVLYTQGTKPGRNGAPVLER